MVAIVPPTVLNLAGLAALPTEPHVQEGNHLRVAHNPLLGLPVAPFILQRADPRQLGRTFGARHDIVFRDQDDHILTLPITLRKGDRIRAAIPQGPALTCIAVTMSSRPVEANQPGPSPAPTPTPGPTHGPGPWPGPGGPIRAGGRNTVLSNLLRRAQPAVAIRQPATRLDPAVIRDALTGAATAKGSGKLLMRAFGPSTAQGSALLGERAEAPHTIAAPGIAEVIITGSGTITDMAWIAAQDFEKIDWQTIEVLNLPHAEGRRYLSVTDPFKRCENRMRAQAPKLHPLQEVAALTTPGGAPPFSDGGESDRVHALAKPLDQDLDVLIDGPAPPLDAAHEMTVTDAAGQPLATAPGETSTIRISHLGRILQGGLDPGVAAWLGYKGLDPWMAEAGGLMLYRVIGFFRHPAALSGHEIDLTGLPLGAIPQGDRQLDEATVFRLVTSLAQSLLQQEGHELVGELEKAGDYMMMGAVAAVDRRAPPLPPAPPVMLAPEHVSWLPAIPPDAGREVECPLKEVLVQATLAAKREQPLPGTVTGLNRRVEGTPWHLPMALGLSGVEDGAPLVNTDERQGFVADRTAGPDAARYHVAQQDRFGRWSPYAQADAAPGPRPKPPRPVLQGYYIPPTVAAAETAGGTLRLRVPLPEVDSLAPGSFPLAHVRLSFSHQDTAQPPVAIIPMAPDSIATVGTAIDIDVPAPGEEPRRAVPVERAGPLLARTEQRRMVVTAWWVDSAGQQSAPSEPLRLLMSDPRPPVQMPIADVLLYSSRPDATGLAWVERSWPTAAGVNYAVFYSDEIRLVSWLKEQGRVAEAEDIAGTQNRAQRAGKLRAIDDDFPDHLFERLPDVIVTPVPGQSGFRHALSGSSRVLSAYKIATEAAGSGARPDLTGLDAVFYGVPNSDPPPRPAVRVKLVAAMGLEPELIAEVTVTVEPGVTTGARARIFRTRGGQADPLHAPEVTTVPLPDPDPVSGRQVLVYRDSGSALIAPDARLTPFSRYQYFAQVQGPPESGSTVPGLWSLPADPVGMAVIPLQPPAVPDFLAFGGTPVAGGMQDLTLTLTHPLGLTPGRLGFWRYQVLRAVPGDTEWQSWVSGTVEQDPLVITEPVAGTLTPFATQFAVRLTDPIGRPAPLLSVITS